MNSSCNECTLSIAVVTMNRAEQLKDALESCLACTLPQNTEFIIIDNASTDNTEDIVNEVLDNCGYNYYYEKLDNNLGVGGGRNYAFEKVKGKYAYFLDDDAVVFDEDKKFFFTDSINILDNNPQIHSLTTQIYDTAWKCNRLEASGNKIADDLYNCYMFCGGSHFLRREFFKESPYLPNKYGYEELLPSLRIADSGGLNVFFDKVKIIHNPLVNKWDNDDEKNIRYLVNECAIKYAIKQMMYPLIFKPLLFAAYKKRCRIYLSKFVDAEESANNLVMETLTQYKIDYKIKLKTVIKLYKQFGMSVL